MTCHRISGLAVGPPGGDPNCLLQWLMIRRIPWCYHIYYHRSADQCHPTSSLIKSESVVILNPMKAGRILQLRYSKDKEEWLVS